MSQLEAIPPWILKAHEHRGHFSQAGFNGILDNWRLFNPLGECLASGDENLRQELERLLNKWAGELALWAYDPRVFWQKIWDRILGLGVVTVPPLPSLSRRTRKALKRLNTRLFFLPKELSEDRFPEGWTGLNWGKFSEADKVERFPFAGRWLAVDVSRKPDWDDPAGYGEGDDPLVKELKLWTPIPMHAKSPRFGHHWKELHDDNGVLCQLAKRIGVSPQSVRLPTAEELEAVVNLLNGFVHQSGIPFPDIGSADSWELVENAVGTLERLTVGKTGVGVLTDMGWCSSGYRRPNNGFRFVIVL